MLFAISQYQRGGTTMVFMRSQDGGWPFRELDELRDEDIDRLFEQTFDRTTRCEVPVPRGWEPSVDIFDHENEMVVRTEIPGMSQKDINISVSGNTLTISGERKSEKEIKEDDYYCCGRSYGRFQRDIALSQGVDTEDIKAAYKNGILEVVIPRKEEAKPKKIEVAVD
jgi:HSP20 family protein